MKCETCKNKSICKYTEEMKMAEDHADNAHKSALSPIVVKAECKKYEDSRCTNTNSYGNTNMIKDYGTVWTDGISY